MRSTSPLPAAPARIALLSPLVIDQIAAGEVVERPASVVKELVDNAIDAGSTRVDVELEEGGLGLIAVRDNGRGIHPDDLLLAVTRHATSKLRDPSELTDIGTLGFRGEALASIAAVARLDLRSRQPSAAVGTHLHSRPGEPPRLTPAGMPVGTQVEVHGLFANLPARRKFMRAEATEVGQCSEILLRLAIVHPEVHVTLRHGKRELLNLPRGTLDQRVAQVLGRRVSGALFTFAGEEDGAQVQLWLPAPEAAGRGRGGPYIVVRRRVVRERSLAQIVAQCYGLTGEATACVIVEPPRASVDVNVHPQKSEVRFSDPQRVYAAVRRVLGAAMAAAPWAASVAVAAGAGGPEPAAPSEPPRGVAAMAAPEPVAGGAGRGEVGELSLRTGPRSPPLRGGGGSEGAEARGLSEKTGPQAGEQGKAGRAGPRDGRGSAGAVAGGGLSEETGAGREAAPEPSGGTGSGGAEAERVDRARDMSEGTGSGGASAERVDRVRDMSEGTGSGGAEARARPALAPSEPAPGDAPVWRGERPEAGGGEESIWDDEPLGAEAGDGAEGLSERTGWDGLSEGTGRAPGTGLAGGTGRERGGQRGGLAEGTGELAGLAGGTGGELAGGTGGELAGGTGGGLAGGTSGERAGLAEGTGGERAGLAEGTGAGRGGYRLSTRALTPDYDLHKRGVMAEAAALRPASEPPRAAEAREGPAPLKGPALFSPEQLMVPAPVEDDAPQQAAERGSGPARADLPHLLTCLPGPVAVFAERDALLAVDLRRLRSHLVYLRLQRDLIGRRVVAVQGLLAPAVVRRPAEEVALVVAARAELLSLGVDIDDFGGDAVVVRGVPAHLRHCVDDADVADLIARIVPWLRVRTRETDASAVERGLIGAIASTRGGDPAPRLARRWLAELIDAGASLTDVPGLRRWTAAALLGGETRRAVAGLGRDDGAAV